MSKKIVGWATTDQGAHYPIFDGQTKEEALNSFIEKKSSAKGKATVAQKKSPTKKVVKVDMDADVQKQLSTAKDAKERQTIAFRYIMDNLRGQYAAPDGRTVAIERVGADKIAHRDNQDKLRACPALADMIKAGEYDHSAPGDDKPNKKFEEFAYYKVRVRMGDDTFIGMLNVGIRKDGSSTLYDLRPFHKDSANKK